MEHVASGGLLPEMDFPTGCSTWEETAVEGEGHVRRFIGSREIQEKLGIMSAPYQNLN